MPMWGMRLLIAPDLQHREAGCGVLTLLMTISVCLMPSPMLLMMHQPHLVISVTSGGWELPLPGNAITSTV